MFRNDYRIPTIDNPPMGAADDGLTTAHRRAITLADEGQPVPVDLALELMEEGIDVDALVKTYGA